MNRQELISDTYRDLQAEFHKARPDYGTFGHKHAMLVMEFCERFGATDILDYGCGKETLREALPMYTVHGYDPAMPEHEEEPIPHSIVTCTSVMEHVEEDRVDAVLDHIASLVIKGVIFTIETGDAKKTLPDGRNAHITQWPAMVWMAKLIERWEILYYRKTIDGALFVCAPPEEPE